MGEDGSIQKRGMDLDDEARLKLATEYVGEWVKLPKKKNEPLFWSLELSFGLKEARGISDELRKYLFDNATPETGGVHFQSSVLVGKIEISDALYQKAVAPLKGKNGNGNAR